MRNLFFIIILSCLSFSSFSQEIQTPKANTETQPKNEFGMNLFSVTNIDLGNDLYGGKGPINKIGPYYSLQVAPPSGIYYKHHLGKNCLRISFDYFQNAVSETQYYTWTNTNYIGYTYSGVKKDAQIKLGYQRSFCSKRFQPFIFLDFIFNYGKYDGNEINNVYGEFLIPYNHNFSLESFQYGGAAGGGLKILICKQVSLTYEFSGTIVYNTFQDLKSQYSTRYASGGIRFNPVRQFGLAFSF